MLQSEDAQTSPTWFIGAITDPLQAVAIYFCRFYHRSFGLEGLQHDLNNDRYTKMAHYLPCTIEITSEETS